MWDWVLAIPWASIWRWLVSVGAVSGAMALAIEGLRWRRRRREAIEDALSLRLGGHWPHVRQLAVSYACPRKDEALAAELLVLAPADARLLDPDETDVPNRLNEPQPRNPPAAGARGLAVPLRWSDEKARALVYVRSVEGAPPAGLRLAVTIRTRPFGRRVARVVRAVSQDH